MRLFRTKSVISSAPPTSHTATSSSATTTAPVLHGDVRDEDIIDEEGRQVLPSTNTIIDQHQYFDALLEKRDIAPSSLCDEDPILRQLREGADHMRQQYVHSVKCTVVEDCPSGESDQSADVEKQEKLMVLTRGSLVQMDLTERTRRLVVEDVLSEEVVRQQLLCDGAFHAPRAEWCITHNQMHGVETDAADDSTFHVLYYPKSTSKSKGSLPLSKLSMHCYSNLERELWVIVFNRILQDYWQSMFEAKIILSPEVYQFHVFMRKVNSKGKEQIRVLIVSDKRMYNVKYKPGDPDPKKSITRWVLPVETLTRVKTYKRSPTSFGFVFDKKRAVKIIKNSKHMHEEYTYVCKDAHEKIRVVSELKRVYYLETHKTLEDVEMVSESGKSKG